MNRNFSDSLNLKKYQVEAHFREIHLMAKNADNRRKYVILDSCVVAGYYVPSSANRYDNLEKNSRLLIDGIGRTAESQQRLLLPAFCIPEVFSIFAKYRFGDWNAHVKNIKQKTDHSINDLKYWKARLDFRRDIHNGSVIQQIDLSRYHILAADLVSPIDHTTEKADTNALYREVPMGAFDHLLIAVGVELVKCRGHENVLIATADNRLGNILSGIDKIDKKTAASLGLIRIAKDLGLDWSSKIYPEVINIASADDENIKDAFGELQLNGQSQGSIEPALNLTREQKGILNNYYKEVTDLTSESFVYTDEFEVFYEAFIAKTGLSASRNQVYRALGNMRKRTELDKKHRKTEHIESLSNSSQMLFNYEIQ